MVRGRQHTGPVLCRCPLLVYSGGVRRARRPCVSGRKGRGGGREPLRGRAPRPAREPPCPGSSVTAGGWRAHCSRGLCSARRLTLRARRTRGAPRRSGEASSAPWPTRRCPTRCTPPPPTPHRRRTPWRGRCRPRARPLSPWPCRSRRPARRVPGCAFRCSSRPRGRWGTRGWCASSTAPPRGARCASRASTTRGCATVR